MSASPPTSRVIAILEALAGAEGSVASATLARSLGLSTSTVSLILATLSEARYVERLPDRSYRLGFGLMRLLESLQGRFPILGVANDELAQLSATLGCGASLTRLGPDGLEVVLAMGSSEQLGIRPGVRMPSDPPADTFTMAWRPPGEVERWLSQVPPATRETYRKGLVQVRSLGFAVYGIRADTSSMVGQLRSLLDSIQTEHDTDRLHDRLDQLAAFIGSRIYTAAELATGQRKDVSHVVAPVFAADRQPRYLISLHLMRQSVPAEELSSHVEALLKSARTLMNQIGGQAPTEAARGRQPGRGNTFRAIRRQGRNG